MTTSDAPGSKPADPDESAAGDTPTRATEPVPDGPPEVVAAARQEAEYPEDESNEG